MKLRPILFLSFSFCLLLNACKKDKSIDPAVPDHQMIQYGALLFSYYPDGKLKTVTYPTSTETYVYSTDKVVVTHDYADNTTIVFDATLNSDGLVSASTVTRTYPNGTVAVYNYEFTYLNKVLQTEKSLNDGVKTQYIYTNGLLTERRVSSNSNVTYVARYEYLQNKPNKNIFSYGMPDLANWTDLHGKPPALLISSSKGYTVSGITETPAGSYTYGYSLDSKGYITQISYTADNGVVISNDVKYQ